MPARAATALPSGNDLRLMLDLVDHPDAFRIVGGERRERHGDGGNSEKAGK